MKIKNHRLFVNGKQVDYKRSPNRGSRIKPEFLVMHYTAGRSFESSLDWLTNPLSRASAHIIIGREGEIAQLVPFNVKAWHAGRSEWNDLTGLNQYSIGIELDNAGKMQRVDENRWLSWFGKMYEKDEVLETTHKHELDPAGWHIYTSRQMEVAVDIAALLVKEYKLKEVIGHDDISPYRKKDPGPAFPMESFSSKVLGRDEDDGPLYHTITGLNIRMGPGIDYEKLEISPLKKGTRVVILNTYESWRFVEVRENGGLLMEDDSRGWVHGRFLSRV